MGVAEGELMSRVILLLAGLLLMVSSASAGDYEDGMAAHKRGDYDIAVLKFRKAAE